MTAADHGDEGRRDDDRPSLARIYDRLLGGAHNFASDRDLADEVSAVYPKAAEWTWANRTFLRHAVDHALDLGIDQFIDLGSGIPTAGSVHETAHRRDPNARVAYVDHETVAVTHSRAVLAEVDHATMTEADVREPDSVLTAPGVSGLLDLSRPVAVLAMAVLHCVPDSDDPAAALAGFRRALAPGSLLALTHTSSDLPDHPELAHAHREVLKLYADTDDPLYGRSRAEIRTLVETAGFTIDADGLVELGRWGPPRSGGESVGGYGLITEPLTTEPLTTEPPTTEPPP